MAGIRLRRPQSVDGVPVHDLVTRCKPLDENSVYCNLLQCSHFADTSVAAERDGELLGFVSGYVPPRNSEALFVWQVAVDERARGLGLAKAMIGHILMRPAMRGVSEIHTTITADNEASQALFKSIARGLDAEAAPRMYFKREDHFDGRHASELLWRIGPFSRGRVEGIHPLLRAA
jgi:L-2,4-diaminobutyric acid acetyltransferase